MSVKLTPEQLDQIKRHGERAIREILPLENIRKDSRHNRVELDPRDYLRAEREASKRDLGVWGYYHSHPNHPAIPSGFDLEHAPFTEWSYLIVSVRDGKAEEVRAWTVREDRSQFDEDTIIIEDSRK